VYHTTYTTHPRGGAAKAGCVTDSIGTPRCQQWHCFHCGAGQWFNQPTAATAAKAARKCQAAQVSREVTAPGKLPAQSALCRQEFGSGGRKSFGGFPTPISLASVARTCFETNFMKAPGIKRTGSPKLARKEETEPEGNTTSVTPAQPDRQAARQPNFLPTSRWGIEELEAALANADGRPATSKPTGAPVTLRVVRFELLAPQAREVFLAGSFNNWSSRATPLKQIGRVRWVTELSLPPGRIEYRFLVDGQWKEDPKAGDYMPNPVGGFNSVRQVE
jgi:hypothetical protein